MNGGIDNEHRNWDEQQTLLSAYLDGELTDGEQARLERHIADCARCQDALAELRRVRALLRALPTPALPRSFLLPESGSLPAPRSVPSPVTPTANSPRSPRRAQPSRITRAAQWVGGLAATVGVGLVIGSVVVGGHRVATNSQGSAARAPSSQNAPAATPHYNSTQRPSSTGGEPHASAAQPTAPTPTSTTVHASPVSTPSPEEVPVAPITGAGLALGGGALLVGGRIAERRRRSGE